MKAEHCDIFAAGIEMHHLQFWGINHQGFA